MRVYPNLSVPQRTSGTAVWKDSIYKPQFLVLQWEVGNGRWGIIGCAINTERLVLDYSGKLFLECPKV